MVWLKDALVDGHEDLLSAAATRAMGGVAYTGEQS
jgi:hypothetical protein